MSSGSPPKIIRTLVGTYDLTRLLNRGGMGEIYLAINNRTQGQVVIKQILPQFADHPSLRARFAAEARSVINLIHPNIIRVFDYDRDLETGAPFLVMEYLPGEDFAQRLAQKGPMRLDQLLPIIDQIGGALHAAHRSENAIVHRDIKPGPVTSVEGRACPVRGPSRNVRTDASDGPGGQRRLFA